MKNQGAFAIVPVDLFDRGLNPGAMVVFAALASFAGKTRVAWPSLSTLAQMVKMTERSVRRCIGELEAAGAISRVPRFDDDGRQTSNAYRLDILMSHFAAQADTGVPPEGDVHDREEEDISVPQTVPVGTIPEEQDPIARERARLSAQVLKVEFEDWYRHYPRKVARGQAEKAFATARRAGVSLETLTDGAKRYARQVAGKEHKYIKHPATWLSGKCWLDEDEPATAATDGELTWWQKSKRAAERVNQRGEQVGCEPRREGSA